MNYFVSSQGAGNIVVGPDGRIVCTAATPQVAQSIAVAMTKCYVGA